MILKPLIRVPLSGSPDAELVEPTAGVATAFVSALDKFPKDGENPSGQHFAGLRALICLYDHGKPFLGQLVNTLHEQNPEQWSLSVLETDSVRAILEALDTAYLVRIVDYFLDAITATQLAEINSVIRDTLWVDRSSEKNE